MAMRFFIIFLAAGLLTTACRSRVEPPLQKAEATITPTPATPQPTVVPSSTIFNPQAELLDGRNKTTAAAIGKFDFKNFTYPLPRGWQNPDGSDIRLVNGRLDPISISTNEEASPDDKADAKANRRIGMSYVTTKFLDVTNDGEDDAFVILKIETAGSALPQIVYVFTWKDSKPELIWPFRTGDRADGGLKDLRVENGELAIELYGQDRFILGQIETGKVTGDREQLCCPSYFTRTLYKWNGKNFLMQGKRLTYPVGDANAAPVENMGEAAPKKDAKK